MEETKQSTTERGHTVQMPLRQSAGHTMASRWPPDQRRDPPRVETQGQTLNQGEGNRGRTEFTVSDGSANLQTRESVIAATAAKEAWLKEGGQRVITLQLNC